MQMWSLQYGQFSRRSRSAYSNRRYIPIHCSLSFRSIYSEGSFVHGHGRSFWSPYQRHDAHQIRAATERKSRSVVPADFRTYSSKQGQAPGRIRIASWRQDRLDSCILHEALYLPLVRSQKKITDRDRQRNVCSRSL